MQHPKKTDLLVVGAGAAGLMAASEAGALGLQVTLLEAGNEAGQKLMLTGGGRCNISNLKADLHDEDHYFGNAPFLRTAFYTLSPQALRDFFAQAAFPLKVEDKIRLYPAKGGAVEVRNFFLNRLRQYGVHLYCCQKVENIHVLENSFLVESQDKQYNASRLLLCCGGASFPHTGSDGSSLKFLDHLGLKYEAFSPALAALELKNPPGKEFAGIVLENIRLSVSWPQGKPRKASYHSQVGDLLLTPFGISGTPVLNLSRYFSTPPFPQLSLDLLPQQNCEELETELRRLSLEQARTMLKNLALPGLPQRLREAFLAKCGINPDLVAAHLSAEQIRQMVEQYKNFEIQVKKAKGLLSAFCSRGGLSLKEVNPRTMESKRIPGLYFAGEILDLDGECGGYNLQAAFAGGYQAALSIAKSLQD